MRNEAVVLDMDGTMLDQHNRVSDTLRDYVQILRRRGKLVFIATGRTLREATDVLPAHFSVDGMVTANGMAVFAGDKLLVQHSLPPKLVEELIEKAGQRQIYYEIHPHEGKRIALTRDEAYFAQHVMEPRPDSVDLSEWTTRIQAIRKEIDWQDSIQAENVAKIYFFSRDKQSMDQWKNELKQIQQRIDFASFPSSEHNIEVMVANISKASGIQYLLQHFKLTREDILVVGDSANDVPLLQLAGYAVAMQNAPETVKQHADEITEFPNDEDGLYRFLHKTFG